MQNSPITKLFELYTVVNRNISLIIIIEYWYIIAGLDHFGRY